jgi:hypothetical protein
VVGGGSNYQFQGLIGLMGNDGSQYVALREGTAWYYIKGGKSSLLVYLNTQGTSMRWSWVKVQCMEIFGKYSFIIHLSEHCLWTLILY